MRVVRNLLAFAFLLIGSVVVAGALALYLAATGHNLPTLRRVVAATGRIMAGQQTTALSLAVRLRPEARALHGVARLTVRATEGPRQRVYFLLNDGLRVDAAWEEAAGGVRTPLSVYRLWLLTVVDLPRALDAGEEIRLVLDYGGHPQAGGLGLGSVVFENDNVVIPPTDLWYPADLQGFFDADVEVLLPANLTLIHNGREVSRNAEGAGTRVRFATERAVAGLALVAGRYELHNAERGGVQARVLLPADVHLDPARLLDMLGASQQTFTDHYGPSGFSQVSLCVNRRLGRGFNDGTGLIALPPRDFADGEYGFGAVAHEVAHNWWGGTVAEQWLQPGTGGEWIVEGFAQLSSWRALRDHLGDMALIRALARAFFDPDRTGTLAAMSVIDNGLDPNARDTIYGKGGYVAYMLEQRLGSEAFDAAARQFLEQFRLRSASATDLQTVFTAASQQDLAPFFSAWVWGDESIDLALDPQEGGAAVRNHRTAPAPAEIALWRYPAGSEPERQTTALDAVVPIGSSERILVDPLAAVADMYRSNNVLPRYDSPRAIARSARGDLMVVSGEPHAWEAATIDVVARGGGKPQSWAIDRGLLSDPSWSADGTRILAVENGHGGEPTLLALNVTDGSRRALGHFATATATADATVVARGARLLRLVGGKTSVLTSHSGGRVAEPLAAPDGAVAYAVVWNTQMMDLRLLPAGSRESRVLFTWPSGPLRWCWAPDSGRLFAVLQGDWDAQLWELPLDGTAPRVLVREAAAISDLAVAADGNRIALVAQGEVDDPRGRSEVFVVDRRGGESRHFDLGGRTASGAAWLDDQSLAVIVADPANPSLPMHAELRTLHLADGTLDAFP